MKKQDNKYAGAELSTIIRSAIIVGLLDGTAAVLHYLARGGQHPEKVFNFVASGLFGKAGLSGGVLMVIAGIVLHLIIAGIWTFIFFGAYARIEIMRRSRILTGLLFGLLVWTIMTRVVLPLSRTPAIPFRWEPAITGALILVIAIGLPLSFFANRAFKKAVADT
ncbi:MAG: hypothetical protein HYZ15_01245 [Sphingobacteriales bacterium]|nr:hypothetical protein [Sphingobacteriales bacterium]